MTKITISLTDTADFPQDFVDALVDHHATHQGRTGARFNWHDALRAGVAAMLKGQHLFVKHEPGECCAHDHGRSCNICEGGLGWCAICGGAEGSLTHECSGTRLTLPVENAIMAGDIDFRDGKWKVKLPWKDAALDPDFQQVLATAIKNGDFI